MNERILVSDFVTAADVQANGVLWCIGQWADVYQCDEEFYEIPHEYILKGDFEND